MNNKILQPQLVAIMAASSGKSKKLVESFLKAFFSTLSETLVNQENVRVKGLGTFKVSSVEARKSVNVSNGESTEIPAHKKIVFVPQKQLAEKVNEEFSWLEIVQISENLSNEELNSITENSEITSFPDYSNSPVKETVSESKNIEAPKEITELHSEITPESSHEKEKETEGEELGEKLEEEFGPIQPVQPFGPIEPDSPDSKVEKITEDLPKEEKPEKVEVVPEAVSAPVIENPRDQDFVPREELEQIEKQSRRRFHAGLLWGFVGSAAVMVIGFLLLYFFLERRIENIYASSNPQPQPIVEQPAPVQEEVEQEKTEELPIATPVEQEVKVEDIKVEKEPVKAEPAALAKVEAPKEIEKAEKKEADAPLAIDVISKTRFLTTMAREYYGNQHFWPYIYKENAKKLGHPDRIKPGTKITVPKIEKYGVDPSNPQDVAAAKQLAQDIYKKYNKTYE